MSAPAPFGRKGRSPYPMFFWTLAVLTAACSTTTEPEPSVATVSVSPSTVTLERGQELDLTVVPRTATGEPVTGRPVTWTSNAQAVATVSSAGSVRAFAPGRATITATVDGRSGSAIVTVPGVPVARIVLSQTSLALRSTDEAHVVATPVAADETPLFDRPVTWETDDASVAVVAPDGYVRAVAPGRVGLRARSEGAAAGVDVTVTSFGDYDLIFERAEGGATGWLAADLDGGAPRTLAAPARAYDVAPSPDGGLLVFAVPEGVPGAEPLQADLWLSDRGGGNARRLTAGPGREHQPAWSPDGTRIAFRADVDGHGGDVWVVGVDGSGLTNLTAGAAADERDPAWSADGQGLVFVSTTTGNAEVWSMRADGTGWVRLTFTEAEEARPVWSPTGTLLAFTQRSPGKSSDLALVWNDGSDFLRIELPGDQADPSWSPDGRILAFASPHEGSSAIYGLHVFSHDVVRRTPAPGGDRDPAWLRRR